MIWQIFRPLMLDVDFDIRRAVLLALLDRLSFINIETTRNTDPHPIEPDIGNNAPLINTSMVRLQCSGAINV